MLALNEFEYLDMPGLSVLLGHDAYPEGHQGGVIIIQLSGRLPPQAAEHGRHSARCPRPSPPAGIPRANRAHGFARPGPRRAARGRYLYYQCLRFDFALVEETGMHVVRYGTSRSNPLQIGADVAIGDFADILSQAFTAPLPDAASDAPGPGEP